MLGAFATTVWSSNSRSPDDLDGIPLLRGPPFLGQFRFFSSKWKFLNEGLQKLGPVFKFKILQITVVTISGEQARHDYLHSSSLDFDSGYAVLHGSGPDMSQIGVDLNSEEKVNVYTVKRMNVLLRKSRLEKPDRTANSVIPELLNDIEVRMNSWGTSGKFNPLDNIYKIVAQLTVRTVACREVADSPAKLDKLLQLLRACETSTNTWTVLLDWWPSKDKQIKQDAITGLYMMCMDIVTQRKASGTRQEDALQMLLDMGDGENDIIQVILPSASFAVVNSGVMSAWILMYLGTNPEWKTKVINELKSLISQYAPSADPSESLASRLSQIPVQVWEDSMVTTDLCLHETIRIVTNLVFYRQNIGNDTVLGGHKIKRGEFVLYPTSDVHLNPEIYSDPLRFDPSRFERREDRKQSLAYLGWGAGRHPCAGMRFAKLEIKLIIAMFLMAFEYEVVDESGDVVQKMPDPDRDAPYVIPSNF
ncbi:cytochrome P450 [Phellopilus nigrolimitatus]|nr:cytochrome P450 [Phellopilus nigrolimitatus]